MSRYHQENPLGNFLATVQIIMIEGLMYGHDNYGMSRVAKSYTRGITMFWLKIQKIYLFDSISTLTKALADEKVRVL